MLTWKCIGEVLVNLNYIIAGWSTQERGVWKFGKKLILALCVWLVGYIWEKISNKLQKVLGLLTPSAYI